MSNLSRFRDLAIGIVLLAIPLFFARASVRDPSDATPLDDALVELSAPVQAMGVGAADAVSSLLEDYVYLTDVKRENDELRRELRRLRSEARLLRELGPENARLRALLGVRERLSGETIGAKVLQREVSPFFRVVRVALDRGAADRVQAGQAVISDDGLVGQVRRTSAESSDVLLTVDRGSAVDVILRRSGARGVLRGTGEDDRYACRIEYLEREHQVEVGDEVYTSGLGQRFPAAILVGRVASVERADFGLYQTVSVTPTVRFSALDEVLIMTEGARGQGLAALSDSAERPE